LSLLSALRRSALERPGEPAFLFLADGEEETVRWSFRELDDRARAIAVLLQPLGAGSRVLLLFPPGLDFLAGFLGCLYAGCVAVPAYPPQSGRGLPRLARMLADARPGAILTTAAFQPRLRAFALEMPALGAIPCWAADEVDAGLAAGWRPPDLSADDLALLQYTSGSTSLPKGVMVSHGNLLANEEMIRRAFDQSRESVVVSWLPPYHDMGLIGGLLQPLYLGARCVLMPPVAFLQRPLRWLRAIARHRGTTSGGPNFAYELCLRRIGEAERAELDLSSWKVAFNGAEPVRAETLERFIDRFGPYGLRPDTITPCYGLAEATLYVTGRKPGEGWRSVSIARDALGRTGSARSATPDQSARSLVGCGSPAPQTRVLIVDPATREPRRDGRVGEVWVASPSVADGYWRREAETAETFQARTATGDGPYLRTGDLGFLRDGELFLTGRRKDLIVVNGQNYYPADIEAVCEAAVPEIRANCGAAFAVESQHGAAEELVVVYEVDAGLDKEACASVIDAIRRCVSAEFGLPPRNVVLVAPRTVPKTSSGKVQRWLCRRQYLTGNLGAVARWPSSSSEGIQL
jgi:acyl-CoA synthetase (AMP-forming)/AMP-acid ligase II